MHAIRIIARLDIKGPNLVKGVHLEGLRVLGDPRMFAEAYFNDLADELIYMDTVASLYGRNSLLDFISFSVNTISIPLTVGGGVRSIEDIRKILRAGADKIAINTAAIRNPELIKEASRMFGSQCIVVSIEAKKISDGKYECFTDNGRERTGVDVFEWSRRSEGLGAGEILLTSVDFEGTGVGYDLELTHRVSELVSIPVIASGGAGNEDHIKKVIIDGRADAVAAASVFHYDKLKFLIDQSLAKEYQEGNIVYLRDYNQGNCFGRKNISPISIRTLKQHLQDSGITCRI